MIPLIGLVLWYFSSFYPYLSELKSIVTAEEKVLSSVSDIYKLATMVESSESIRRHGLQQAYLELVFEKDKRADEQQWYLNTTLWYLSSYLHFDENEIFYLWSSSVYVGERGLQNSSIHLFGKELSELSLRQKAELIAMVEAPDYFKLHGDALKKRADSILGIK